MKHVTAVEESRLVGDDPADMLAEYADAAACMMAQMTQFEIDADGLRPDEADGS